MTFSSAEKCYDEIFIGISYELGHFQSEYEIDETVDENLIVLNKNEW